MKSIEALVDELKSIANNPKYSVAKRLHVLEQIKALRKRHKA